MPFACPRGEPSAEPTDRKSRAAASALVLGLALLVGAGALASLPPAGGDEPVAILFPFWIGRAEAVARSFEAGERVLRTGRLSSIVVVAPQRPGATSWPRGAWLSLRLAGLAGCLDDKSGSGELQ